MKIKKLEKLGIRFTNLFATYDSLMIESGGRCCTDAYMDEYLVIAKKCIHITGKSDYVIDLIDKAIMRYSSDENKNWKYLDRMLTYLSAIKNNILSL